MTKFLKVSCTLLIMLTALFCLSLTSWAAEPIQVYLNGNVLTFQDQNPTIVDDRTLVPFRGVLEAMGASVDWDGKTRTVTAEKDGVTVNLIIDNPAMTKNGETILLDVPAKIINDRTMVPARAVSESFGARVEWNSQKRAVVISTDAALNRALDILNMADEFYWVATVDFTYENMPVYMEMTIGIDKANKKYLNTLLVNMESVGESSSSMLVGKDKTFFVENGNVTEGVTSSAWKPMDVFDEGTPFLANGTLKGNPIYKALDNSGLQLVIDKNSGTPVRLFYPKEILGEVTGLPEGVFNENMDGEILLNSNKLMKLWNQYENR